MKQLESLVGRLRLLGSTRSSVLRKKCVQAALDKVFDVARWIPTYQRILEVRDTLIEHQSKLIIDKLVLTQERDMAREKAGTSAGEIPETRPDDQTRKEHGEDMPTGVRAGVPQGAGVHAPKDCHLNGKILDSRGRECLLFPDVPAILSWLESKNIQVALASRITNIAGACLLLNLFNIRHHFWPVEVYPTSKVLHFEQIRKKTEMEYCDMIFFDDDKRNLRDLARFELPCVHVPKGLKFDEFIGALSDVNRQFKEG
ncbi:hypothetical protein GE061_005761 [Apolygus lucorum]|uniref:Uncharacterized protein n=1 Tax=Apolygus lucorum TaxID=248454 RepID=A0A8S9WXA3_APOLU|nr:hypothetical protein GE061_005761 [Apolygus lucorum]